MRPALLAGIIAVLFITGVACSSSRKSELVNAEELTTLLPPHSSDVSPVRYHPKEFGIYREAASISLVTSLSDAEVIAWYKQQLSDRGWTFLETRTGLETESTWEHKQRNLEFGVSTTLPGAPDDGASDDAKGMNRINLTILVGIK
ncbi:MAG: hypothetical protein ACKVPX_12105 [Myxococcaceae bacterium]